MSGKTEAYVKFALMLRDYQKHCFAAGFHAHLDPRRSEREKGLLNAKQDEMMRHVAVEMGVGVEP